MSSVCPLEFIADKPRFVGLSLTQVHADRPGARSTDAPPHTMLAVA